MDKLSIFKIEDASTKTYEAIRISCFPGTDPEDAVIGFNKLIFENNQSLLYARLRKKLGDETEWECNEDFTDCVHVGGTAARVAIRPHYRFERNSKGQLVKANPERIIKFVKVVAFAGETVESEVQRYLAQVPDELLIDDEEKDD